MAFLVTILDQDSRQLVLTLDASLSESHSAEAEATDHPVEQGANITDHIRPKPQMLTIEGFVSNTPSDSAQTQNGEFPRDSAGPAEAAFAALEARRLAGKLHIVSTSLQTYENMALLGRPVTRNAQVGNALAVMLLFKEIRVVFNQTIQVQTQQPQGQPTSKKGKKVTTPVAPSNSNNATVLKGLTNFFGVTTPGSGT